MTSEISSSTALFTASSPSTQATGSGDVMGKEDFLTLLVTQLQNQDPMNPDDPTEFTSQLAEYSSLEQLTNLNSTMNTLVDAYGETNRLSTLGTIGKEVVYNTGSFNYTGEPTILGYNIDGPASEVTLTLKNNGVTTAVLSGDNLTKGTHYLEWDGTTSDGKPAPAGNYEIIIETKGTSDTTVNGIPLIRSVVTGVDLKGSNGGVLETGSGSTYFNSILGVFEPGSFS